MAVTKYVPVNILGSSAPTVAVPWVPEAGAEYVLTEVIASNSDDSPRKITVSWVKDSNDVFLMDEVSMPPKSVMNLNLYLPLTEANAIKVTADASSQVYVTLNGLKLEEVS